MSFQSAAIRFIRVRSAEVQGTRDLEIVGLAAHLFAIASQLLLNEGSARLLTRLERLEPAESVKALLPRLADLPEDSDASDLYRILLTALVTIEFELWRTPTLVLPAWTDLTDLEPGNYRGLRGRVYHWIRPRSALAKARWLRYDEADEHPPDPAPHPGIYLERLAMYWDSDPQLPAVTRVRPAPKVRPFFRRSGADAAVRKRLRIALCPLVGDFYPRFAVTDPEGGFFQALEDGMAGREELHRHLSALMDLAEAGKVNLLVLPELTVDLPARDHLRDLLAARLGKPTSLYGVVAGSFHVWTKRGEPLPVNEALFLAHTGKAIGDHLKKGRFRVGAGAVKPPFFPKAPDRLQDEIFEDVRYGSELKILDTSLGRLALLICADAIASDDRGYLPVIRKLRPDLLVVVAMTPETPLFEAFAEEMSRYWIGTLFVNAHCMARAAGPGTHLAACNLALYEPEGMPPTRVRWRYGKSAPECIYFKPAHGVRGWRRIRQKEAGTGASLLRINGRPCGLVLDLGVHWKSGVLASAAEQEDEE